MIVTCLMKGRPPMLWLERPSNKPSLLGRVLLSMAARAHVEVCAIGVLAQESYRAMGFRRSAVHMFPYSYGQPVDISAVRPSNILRASRTSSDVFRVLVVAREWSRKGLDVLASAIEATDRRLEITVVGLDKLPPEIGSNSDRMVCVGFVEPPLVGELLQTHDVLVVPSRFDGWAVVVEEAMRRGVPVIGTDEVGSVGTLLIDGYSGLVVEAGSASSLQGAIERLQGDPELSAALGDGALSAADWHGRRFNVDSLRVLVERIRSPRLSSARRRVV